MISWKKLFPQIWVLIVGGAPLPPHNGETTSLRYFGYLRPNLRDHHPVRQSIKMKYPITTVIQILQLFTLSQSLSLSNFLLVQIFIQALIMFGYFTIFWAYAW